MFASIFSAFEVDPEVLEDVLEETDTDAIGEIVEEVANVKNTFLGMSLSSTFDYVMVYGICGAIILIGILILLLINKSSKPVPPDTISVKLTECKNKLQEILNDVENPKIKSSALTRKLVNLQVNVNKLIYSCTVIIEDNRDITYENVRTHFQNVIHILDNMSFSFQKNIVTKSLNSAMKEFTQAEEKLYAISQRVTKFGS